MSVCMYVCPPGGRTQTQIVYMACVSLYGRCQFIWHVLVYMACVSLYGMFSIYMACFQFIWHVSVYTACFQFIWHVSVYIACVSLYCMSQYIWHVFSLYGII